MAGTRILATPAAPTPPESGRIPEPLISLVAIGDPPTPDFQIKDSRRLLNPVSESEYPPPLLHLKVDGRFKPISLVLNSAPTPFTHPSGQELELFTNREGTPPPFIKIPIPPTSEDLTVFLIRNPDTKSWRLQPQARVYESGLKAFPKDSVRIINFARMPVMIEVMESKAFELPALGENSVKVVPLPHAAQGIFKYKATLHGKSGPIVIDESSTNYLADQRINLVIYETDGTDRRRPVKVAVYSELPYQNPPAAGKTTDKH